MSSALKVSNAGLRLTEINDETSWTEGYIEGFSSVAWAKVAEGILDPEIWLGLVTLLYQCRIWVALDTQRHVASAPSRETKLSRGGISFPQASGRDSTS